MIRQLNPSLYLPVIVISAFASEEFLNGDSPIAIAIPIDSKVFVTIEYIINVLVYKSTIQKFLVQSLSPPNLLSVVTSSINALSEHIYSLIPCLI